MDCMRELAGSPLYPALLIQNGDLSDWKVVLIPSFPDRVQAQHVIFEIRYPFERATTLLEIKHCKIIEISTLTMPFCSPDGKVIVQRWICYSSVLPVGWIIWNKTDHCMKSITPRLHFPLSITFCCFEDITNDPIEHPDLSSNDMVPDSENALSSSKTPKHLSNIVEDELPHGGIPEPKAMKVDDDISTSTTVISTAESEHDLAKLLPTDPFGMDSSTSWN